MIFFTMNPNLKKKFLYPRFEKVGGGGYTGLHLSVRGSVRPSVRPFVIP